MPAASPFCSHLAACPGCPRFGDLGVPVEAERQLTALAVRLGVEKFGMIPAPQVRYRHRSRLAVRGRAGRPKIGLFELGTHQVVDIPHCAVHHPSINQVALAIKQLLGELRLAPYSDTAHAGLIRYLQLVVERESGRVQVVVVANSKDAAPLRPLFQALEGVLGDRLHSLFFNRQTQPTNAILGDTFERWSGPEHIVEHIGGAAVCYPPGAFGQASPELFDAIVERVHGWIPEGQAVTELYAGVGAIGLGLVERSRLVRFNERSPDGLSGLEQGIQRLAPELRSKTSIHAGPAESAVAEFGADAHVIVDPPRRGLDEALLRQLAQSRVRRVLYVSCGLESFLRDAELLSRTHQCRELFGYALFPFTEHVETVACFEVRD
jgi:23S rRNA (uracil1939-C5)-methyltransferase